MDEEKLSNIFHKFNKIHANMLDVMVKNIYWYYSSSLRGIHGKRIGEGIRGSMPHS
jgi:hypothetical protein